MGLIGLEPNDLTSYFKDNYDYDPISDGAELGALFDIIAQNPELFHIIEKWNSLSPEAQNQIFDLIDENANF